MKLYIRVREQQWLCKHEHAPISSRLPTGIIRSKPTSVWKSKVQPMCVGRENRITTDLVWPRPTTNPFGSCCSFYKPSTGHGFTRWRRTQLSERLEQHGCSRHTKQYKGNKGPASFQPTTIPIASAS